VHPRSPLWRAPQQVAGSAVWQMTLLRSRRGQLAGCPRCLRSSLIRCLVCPASLHATAARALSCGIGHQGPVSSCAGCAAARLAHAAAGWSRSLYGRLVPQPVGPAHTPPTCPWGAPLAPGGRRPTARQASTGCLGRRLPTDGPLCRVQGAGCTLLPQGCGGRPPAAPTSHHPPCMPQGGQLPCRCPCADWGARSRRSAPLSPLPSRLGRLQPGGQLCYRPAARAASTLLLDRPGAAPCTPLPPVPRAHPLSEVLTSFTTRGVATLLSQSRALAAAKVLAGATPARPRLHR
jgi:hypothetical protein